MHYRVELEELLAFVDKLQAFEAKAEALAARVDVQVSSLHTTWAGTAAAAHLTGHDEWMAAATEMREALADLRNAAENAHRNYTDAVKTNLAMLTS
jgi:WXG100 family type VII secretion target